MNCILCYREMLHPTPSGMGKVCAAKNRLDTGEASKPIIELVYDSGRGRRNYLIRTANREKIFLAVIASEEIVRCHFCETGWCEHQDIISEYDRARFPGDYASKAVCLSKLEFIEAARRGADSNLEVFADFEQDSYVVVNLDTNADYRVKLESRNGRLHGECDCPDFVYRKRGCKHIAEVLTDALFKAVPCSV